MRYMILIFILLNPLNVSGFDTPFSKEDKFLITNLAGLTAITAWGVANWDYFVKSPSAADEGWFSDDTEEGGADKFGHLYISYASSRLLAAAYKNWGYSDKSGALLGSLSSFALTSWMEIGDSFSDYGFSFEDFIMNGIGTTLAYFIDTTPELSDRIDFRVEYMPSFDSMDFFTDYEHLKYLIAIKLDGFECIRQEYLKYLEIHLGYYARGYSEQVDRRRNIYIGLGINLSKIFNDLSMDKASKATSYIQIPYTYLAIEKGQ